MAFENRNYVYAKDGNINLKMLFMWDEVPLGRCRSCWPAATSILKFKIKCLVYTIISNVLLSLHFSQNKPLKLADNWYIRIMKIKINLESFRSIKKRDDQTL